MKQKPPGADRAAIAAAAERGPGLQQMTNTVGPEGTEAIRQKVLADQAAAKAAVAKTPTPTNTVKTTPAKKAKAPPTKVKAPPAKASKAATGNITMLAKTNPHAAGSRRAGWFRQLKSGMTLAEAVELGVPPIYLRRMEAKGVIKITK